MTGGLPLQIKILLNIVGKTLNPQNAHKTPATDVTQTSVTGYRVGNWGPRQSKEIQNNYMLITEVIVGAGVQLDCVYL